MSTRETRSRTFYCYPREREVTETYDVVSIGSHSQTARHSCQNRSSVCPRLCKFLVGTTAFGVIDPEVPPA